MLYLNGGCGWLFESNLSVLILQEGEEVILAETFHHLGRNQVALGTREIVVAIFVHAKLGEGVHGVEFVDEIHNAKLGEPASIVKHELRRGLKEHMRTSVCRARERQHDCKRRQTPGQP